MEKYSWVSILQSHFDHDVALAAQELMAVIEERDKYLAAIRKHMNMRGDDRCYIDDNELYAVLPEGDTRPQHEVAVTIENCQRFIDCRQQGREYISPQREIQNLKIEISLLKNVIEEMVNTMKDKT